MKDKFDTYRHVSFRPPLCSAIIRASHPVAPVITHSATYQAYNLDTRAGITSVKLGYASALSLPQRFAANGLHLVVRTDYALTVRFNPTIIASSAVLATVKQELENLNQGQFELDICYQDSHEIAMLVVWQLDEHWEQYFESDNDLRNQSEVRPPIEITSLYWRPECVPRSVFEAYVQAQQKIMYFDSKKRPHLISKVQQELNAARVYRGNLIASDSAKEPVLNMLAIRVLAHHQMSLSHAVVETVINQHIDNKVTPSSYTAVQKWVASMNSNGHTYNAAFFADHFDHMEWSSRAGIKFQTARDRRVKANTGIILNNKGTDELDYSIWVEKSFYFLYSEDFDIAVIKDLMSNLRWDNDAILTYDFISGFNGQRMIRIGFSTALAESDLSSVDMCHWQAQVKTHTPIFDMVLRVFAERIESNQQWWLDQIQATHVDPQIENINQYLTAKTQKLHADLISVIDTLTLSCVEYYCNDWL